MTILECGGMPPLFLLRPSRGLGDLGPVGIHFATCPARQPVNRTEEKNHGNNEPRISRRYSQVSQDNNVPSRHEQRRNHDNEERSIHRHPSPPRPRAGTAPGWYPSPTKSRP